MTRNILKTLVHLKIDRGICSVLIHLFWESKFKDSTVFFLVRLRN